MRLRASRPSAVEKESPDRAGKRALPWLVGGTVLAALLAAGCAWLVLLGPYGYEAPDTPATIDEGRIHTVFVYGTLRNRLVRRVVIGRSVEVRPATLPGYRKEGLDVVPEPGSHTTGLVFEVGGVALRRLDRYERVGVRYVRIERVLADGTPAWVYRRLP
jgi:gamma-glutamylcyclotransferase (GGCT)/AIG2-like uncharacterized protein YtfP